MAVPNLLKNMLPLSRTLSTFMVCGPSTSSLIASYSNSTCINLVCQARQISTSLALKGNWDRRDYAKEAPVVDQGAEGEKYYQWMRSSKFKYEEFLPTLETHKELFNGIRYDMVPICYIRVSRNNTIVEFRKGKRVNEGFFLSLLRENWFIFN